MEPNKERKTGNKPPSRIVAELAPEVLSHVLTFIDLPELPALFRASHRLFRGRRQKLMQSVLTTLNLDLYNPMSNALVKDEKQFQVNIESSAPTLQQLALTVRDDQLLSDVVGISLVRLVTRAKRLWSLVIDFPKGPLDRINPLEIPDLTGSWHALVHDMLEAASTSTLNRFLLRSGMPSLIHEASEITNLALDPLVSKDWQKLEHVEISIDWDSMSKGGVPKLAMTERQALTLLTRLRETIFIAGLLVRGFDTLKLFKTLGGLELKGLSVLQLQLWKTPTKEEVSDRFVLGETTAWMDNQRALLLDDLGYVIVGCPQLRQIQLGLADVLDKRPLLLTLKTSDGEPLRKNATTRLQCWDMFYKPRNCIRYMSRLLEQWKLSGVTYSSLYLQSPCTSGLIDQPVTWSRDLTDITCIGAFSRSAPDFQWTHPEKLVKMLREAKALQNVQEAHEWLDDAKRVHTSSWNLVLSSNGTRFGRFRYLDSSYIADLCQVWNPVAELDLYHIRDHTQLVRVLDACPSCTSLKLVDGHDIQDKVELVWQALLRAKQLTALHLVLPLVKYGVATLIRGIQAELVHVKALELDVGPKAFVSSLSIGSFRNMIKLRLTQLDWTNETHWTVLLGPLLRSNPNLTNLALLVGSIRIDDLPDDIEAKHLQVLQAVMRWDQAAKIDHIDKFLHVCPHLEMLDLRADRPLLEAKQARQANQDEKEEKLDVPEGYGAASLELIAMFKQQPRWQTAQVHVDVFLPCIIHIEAMGEHKYNPTELEQTLPWQRKTELPQNVWQRIQEAKVQSGRIPQVANAYVTNAARLDAILMFCIGETFQDVTINDERSVDLGLDRDWRLLRSTHDNHPSLTVLLTGSNAEPAPPWDTFEIGLCTLDGEQQADFFAEQQVEEQGIVGIPTTMHTDAGTIRFYSKRLTRQQWTILGYLSLIIRVLRPDLSRSSIGHWIFSNRGDGETVLTRIARFFLYVTDPANRQSLVAKSPRPASLIAPAATAVHTAVHTTLSRETDRLGDDLSPSDNGSNSLYEALVSNKAWSSPDDALVFLPDSPRSTLHLKQGAFKTPGAIAKTTSALFTLLAWLGLQGRVDVVVS